MGPSRKRPRKAKGFHRRGSPIVGGPEHEHLLALTNYFFVVFFAGFFAAFFAVFAAFLAGMLPP